MEAKASASADARERLLVAAQALYAERGVAATTPRQVLERSSVGQGSLYHHFPSKRDLARAAVDRTIEEQLEVARQVLVGDGAERRQIRHRVREQVEQDRGLPDGIGSDESDQHVAAVRDARVRQHALQVGLRDADHRAEARA